jgi:hypothetical protein
MVPNVTARNISIAEHDGRYYVDRHVEIPINRDTFFEFVRLVFDTGAVVENELEVRHRAFLDKFDRDICANIFSLLISDCGAAHTLQMNISVSVASGQHVVQVKVVDPRLTVLDRPYRLQIASSIRF